jgi:hypothetical protein
MFQAANQFSETEQTLNETSFCFQNTCIHLIIRGREGFRSQGTRTLGETTMKRAVRMLILMVGLVCTYTAFAAPAFTAPDGGPIPLCNPKNPANCKG